ncbi:sugar-binding transcriptional regulator [Geminicoccus flavidas]|uniref:sugar-binding transcriptional regulator n=1 Tax=Geminicoccus flavidas TaxID=2506407 RepID=UPI001359A236|nr:sugar-binding domain-containing protein [Geminicoccus flavidas]
MDDINLATEPRRELAARAAWLWYVKGDTQEEIARSLGLSRAAVQRLVAQALAERLVSVRIQHPIAACMRLSARIEETYGIGSVDVVPDVGGRALAHAAAARLDRVLTAKVPTIVAVGAGRAVRAAAAEVAAIERPQHQIIGMVGSIARSGSANPYEVVVRLADRIGAQRWPMPMPLVVDSPDERDLWQSQRLWRILEALAERVTLGVSGIGQMGAEAPLVADGFIDSGEMADLIAHGAVAELSGFVYDMRGQLLDHPHNLRVTSLPLPRPHPLLAIAAGLEKLEAVRAVLRGRLIDQLVTDESTARLLCESA